MKKVITIFLLLLLCLNGIGLYPVFKLIQIHTKELAKEIINRRDPRDLIVFADLNNNKEITWDETDKEFSYHGKMYDVAREETDDNHLLFYCYNDKKEAIVSKQIDLLVNELLSTDNHPSQNVVLRLMMMLAQIFIPSEPYSFTKKHGQSVCVHIDRYSIGKFMVCSLDVPLPPPWA